MKLDHYFWSSIDQKVVLYSPFDPLSPNGDQQ